MNDTTFQSDGKIAFVPVVVNAKQPKQTNADKIRAMTDEELDGFLNEVQGDAYLVGFYARAESRFTPYGKRWLGWLKQEANDET